MVRQPPIRCLGGMPNWGEVVCLQIFYKFTRKVYIAMYILVSHGLDKGEGASYALFDKCGS